MSGIRASHTALRVAAVLTAMTLHAAIACADGGVWLAPLTVETAETIDSGQIDLALGASYFNDARYPPFTVPSYVHSQSLTMVPQLGLRAAVGHMVEIQAAYELIDLDENTVDGHNHTYGGGDAHLFTKIHAVNERTWLPAMGVRFGVKLPNANQSERLGTDDIDFDIQWLGSKHFLGMAGYLNLGIAILGNPGTGLPGTNPDNPNGQDDLFTYGIGLVSPTLGAETAEDWGLRGLLEVSGDTGSRFDNDAAAVRGGVQVLYGGWTIYLGASGGLYSAAEKFGFMGGAIYAFDVERLAALFE